MSTKWQRVAVSIPPEYGPDERVLIAQEIIDYIRERTLNGRDKNNEPWTGSAAVYSKAYKAKTGKTLVDLRLSGDMLDALSLLSHNSGKLLIGFKNGTTENGKADGNIRGTYGNPKPISGKARDFLGISDKDLENEILSNYPLKENNGGN